MATIEEIKPGRIFRHKGGRLYMIRSKYNDETAVRWGGLVDAGTGRPVYDPLDQNYPYQVTDKSKVWAVQWQVNEKHPNGRKYQADRELKIADLTAIDA